MVKLQEAINLIHLTPSCPRRSIRNQSIPIHRTRTMTNLRQPHQLTASSSLLIPTTIPINSLSAQLQQIGLRAVPAGLDDFLARATKSRWSPRQILEQLAQSEGADRSRRSLERRLRLCGVKGFKPMADFDWSWPTSIERDIIERAALPIERMLAVK